MMSAEVRSESESVLYYERLLDPQKSDSNVEDEHNGHPKETHSSRPLPPNVPLEPNTSISSPSASYRAEMPLLISTPRNGDGDGDDEENLITPFPPVQFSLEKKTSKQILGIIFLLMLVFGLLNRIFNKLMTIPMHNYPNFLNLLTTGVYIPVCFAYIWPMTWGKRLSGGDIFLEFQVIKCSNSMRCAYLADLFKIPKKTFLIMGVLDSVSGIMQMYGATYISGPMIVLLLQAAIPVSMVISKYMVQATYKRQVQSAELTLSFDCS